MLSELPIKRIPLPTPFPVGDINSYLIISDPLTIIDPGPCYQPSEDLLYRFLKESGVELKDIKRIVITHGHADHYGMAGKIQRETGAEVLVRDREVEKLELTPGYIENKRRIMLTTGISGETLDMDGLYRGDVPFTHPIDKIKTYSGDCLLGFDNFEIRLLHTPGHSGGHTSLFWEEMGVLFSGDLLLPEITAIALIEYDPREKNLRCRSLAHMLKSMELVGAINPSLCLPGHGDPVSGPAALARSRIDFHKVRLDEIYSIVPMGRENAADPCSLSRVYYPNVKDLDIILAVIEVVAHLDYLADEGRIEEYIDEKGVSLFYRRLQ
ncbi:MAG: MBL fold metallo-hydrolase [Actinobacteria bacterium]|nr:MBL fold metallo-hydrolase [Actinomycetota bacterium]